MKDLLAYFADEATEARRGVILRSAELSEISRSFAHVVKFRASMGKTRSCPYECHVIGVSLSSMPFTVL